MDVLLFTSEEPLYLPRYVEPILDAHAPVIDAVIIAPPRASWLVQLRRQHRMFGTVDFLRIGRRFATGRLLGTLPPTLDRALTGRFHSVASVAAVHEIPVHRVSDVTAPEFRSWVTRSEPDVVLSIVCGQRLPPDVLDVPDVAINLHGSLLPNYRGRAVAFWPLYSGDDVTGVTAHLMTDTFDAGPIVNQRSFPIGPDDSMHDIYQRLADVGADLAIDLLNRLPGDLDTRPNPTGPDDYHTLPGPVERREFRRRGNAFL